MRTERKTPGLPVRRSRRANHFAIATIPWQLQPPRDSLTIVMKATFDIVPGFAVQVRRAPAVPTGDLYADDRALAYASDFAVWKRRADVTLRGVARPLSPTTAMRVTFRFGQPSEGRGFDRTIAVLGNRRWVGSALSKRASDPQPFEEMPLTYARACGGPAHDPNPIGVGIGPGDIGATLPNLEALDASIQSPSDAPPPACFAPIAPSWAERRAHLGTYDARWRKERWPYWPEDVDFSHEQSAPRAQQLPYLSGDEAFEIVGMRRAHPTLTGRLPALSARCIAERRVSRGGSLLEVAMNLDTAAFDVEQMTVDLVWRGVIEVEDDEAADLEALWAHVDAPGDARRTAEEIHAGLVAQLEAIPEPLIAPTPPANEIEPEEEDPEAAALERELDARRAELAAKLAAAGFAPGPVPAPASVDEVIASLVRGGMSEAEANALRDSLREPPEDAPFDRRAEILRRIAGGERLDGADLSGLDLAGINLDGRSLVGADLRRANLVHASLIGCDLTGAVLEGTRAPGARFDRAVLDDSNLHDADLQQASFRKARLAGAIMTAVRADGADFGESRGNYLDMADASLRGARFDDAELEAIDLSRTVLDGASLVRAQLRSARLYDARALDARLDGADLDGLRADEVVMPRASFRGVRATGSIWESADLTGAVFLGATLEGASFARVRAARASFSAAALSGANFRRADLSGATFLKADAQKASFERANLRGADLRGACLHGAELYRADLSDVHVELAIVSGSKLAEPK